MQWGTRMQLEGFYTNLTNAKYHSLKEYLSSTDIKTFLNSGAKKFFHFCISKKSAQKQTEALKIGTLLHLGVLEGIKGYEIGPNARANSNEFKEARKEAEKKGLELVKPKVGKMLNEAIDAVQSIPRVRKLLNGALIEHSGFTVCRYTGLKVRVRCDARNVINEKHIIIDYKSTQFADEKNFKKSIFKYGYHISAAHYVEVVEQLTGRPVDAFIFIAQEKTFPYEVGLYYLDPDVLKLAKKVRLKALFDIKKCLEVNKWPGLNPDLVKISLSNYDFEQLLLKAGE